MHYNQRPNRLISTNDGPVLPNREMNIDFSNSSNAFTAIRNMNLLPSSSISTPQSVSSFTLDDNISLRSSQSAQYFSSKHLDSPLSIHSVHSVASQPLQQRPKYHSDNFNSTQRQQIISGYDPYKRSNDRIRQILSANNTPMTKKRINKERGQRRARRGKRKRRSHSHSRLDEFSKDTNSNFKVVVRVRPPLQRELQSPLGFGYIVRVDNSQKSIAVSDGFADEEDQQYLDNWSHNIHKFTFDNVYPETADQKQVYETTAKHSVLSTLQGYNASIIAYGQTSAGKTYTMEGFDSERLRGIIPRAIEEIFNYIEQKASPTMRFLVRASYLQIYNEVISDLLKTDRTNLQIREDKKKGVYVSGLSEWVVRSCEEIYGLIKRGAQCRTTCATKLNQISSRSHAIFIIIVEQNEIKVNKNGDNFEEINNIKIGKLNLVDLAGSERVRISGAQGQRLEESKNINQSLSALGNVISALTDPKRIRKHIPYRDSKLTRILEDSLGGNCKTTMMAMISPALEHYSETVSTLKFANRAKNIKNLAVVNQDLNEKALLRKYEKELKRLKAELAEKSKNVVDKSKLIELQEQKNKAERDKMTAIQYLEKISQDLEKEKLEKHELMRQIAEMNSKLLTNSINNSNKYEMEIKTDELLPTTTTTTTSIPTKNKEQVERYKQLLMKQRDIMIQLTSRLNDRDQSILALQEELDHYDNQQKMMENVLDQKTVKLIKQLNTKSEEIDNNNNDIQNNDNYQQKLEYEKMEKIKLKQELKEVHADKTSLEYLLRGRINDMVQKEVNLQLKQQETELEKWRSKYESAEERRRNSEYLLELSRVGGKADVLQKQLKQILQKERTKIEEKFHNKIKQLKQAFILEKKLLNQNKDKFNNNNNHNNNCNQSHDNKTMFAELKTLKNLHNKFSKMQQKVEQIENDSVVNQLPLKSNNTNLNIENIINNEDLSELVCDLKQLHNIEQLSNNNSNNIHSQNLKQNIEQKIRILVQNITNKVLNEENESAELVKNDIIKAQQIINNSFDILS